ncbi:MAG: insulinase family protein [Ignavibacteriae bacterium]|nr:MAG: insulinase family protein [Ignavibacteriota bacterium]
MELLNIEYEKYKLANGLEVILHKNNNSSLVAVNLWYKVGSANDSKGKTGIAHLFEHMMFKGSQNVQKEMHFRYIQEAGGTLNGSTSFDRTNHYEKLPSNFLEMALWLEADRMGYFLPALDKEKLNNQKDVVKNERLERYDNQPYGLAWELLIKNLYSKDHPYHWPTIGFLDDITSYTLEDVSGFFKKFYTPNNSSLVVAGDIDLDKTKDLINKYFAPIEPGAEIEELTCKTNPLKENISVTHKDKIQLERLYLSWHSDKLYGEDDAALDILSDILSGSKNSRLHKLLVFEKEYAQDVTTFQFSGKYAGQYIVIITAKPGITLDKLKTEVMHEIEKLISDGIKSREMEKAKNSIKSSFIFSLQKLDLLADQLNTYNFHLNEPNSFNYDLNRYNIIDESKVISAAEKYLTKPYLEIRIVPDK